MVRQHPKLQASQASQEFGVPCIPTGCKDGFGVPSDGWLATRPTARPQLPDVSALGSSCERER